MSENKIEFSPIDKLSADEFEKKNIKIRITTFIDQDILEKLKEEAANNGKKYQTLLNEKLREKIFEEESIQVTINQLDKRLSLVEKQIKAV